ncbi:MAG: ABC transporter substrate-binding protein [Bacillota bacterium]|nr:ABC transporter substrate-binding protein [Bacillota bacterium]
MTNKYLTKWMAVLLGVLLLLLPLAACGGSSATTAAPEKEADATETAAGTEQETTSAEGDSVVNIGVTNKLSTFNPLLLDATEVAKYAQGLSFLPLVELDSQLNFVPLLASSVETEDNITFTVTLDEKAVWSDGVPVTSDDVIWFILNLMSETIGNSSFSTFYMFKGFDDETGQVPDGTTEVEGLVRVDEKTLQFVAKMPISLETFQNTFIRYILPLPKHVLGEMSPEELKTTTWFNQPEVVSGPYRMTEIDPAHYVSYVANDNYFRGRPKIDRLNIRVRTPSQILSGLKSGEIDFVQNTMAAVPQEDFAAIAELDNVEVAFDNPVTSNLIFINTKKIPDVNMRRAMLLAIDRQQLVDGLLLGNGEIADGFLTSASPYNDGSLEPVAYDLEAAKELMAQVDWDESRVLDFKVNSGDQTFVNGANVIAAQLAEIGIKVQVTPLDIDTLLTDAANHDCDMMAVQYTLAPVDPFPDIEWLVAYGDDSWTCYDNPEVTRLLGLTQQASREELTEYYMAIDRIMQDEVPIINTYVLASFGASAKRLVNAKASVYGFFNAIETWELVP